MWNLKQKKFGNNNHSALDNTVKSTNMKKSIDTYIKSIAHDEAEFIVNGSESIADYIINTAEYGTGYEEFFDDDELDETGEPTQEQIDELKAYLNENYDYLPECNLEDIAAENGLELIDTTSARNGYPQDLQKAIIGFDSFEQAEELAKENGLSIEIFHKRDGWDMWYRTRCHAHEPFERSADEYGDDYREFSKKDLEDFYENEVQPMVEVFGDFDTLRSYLGRMERIKDEIEEAEEGEIVITYCGEYFDTIVEHPMAYHCDSNSYAIGLIDRNKD